MIIRTSRLVLRPLEKGDCARVADLIGDWDVSRWLVMPPYPYTVQHAFDFLEQLRPSYERGEPDFFVIANPATNEVMGGVGLHPSTINPENKEEVSLGYWLGRPYWGKGYMTEAATAAIKDRFSYPHITRIAANTEPDNTTSIKVLTKIGFTYLGEHERAKVDSRPVLRGGTHVKLWQLDRKDFEEKKCPVSMSPCPR